MATLTDLPSTMRAAQWHSVSGSMKNLKTTKDAKLPKKVSGSVLPRSYTLVRVAYASLNHLDYKTAELRSLFMSKPATPGLDFAGTVVATDSTGTGLKPGQRVLGRTDPPGCGTLAEYVLVGKAGIAALPDGVSLRDAACVGICGVAALQCLAPYLKPTAASTKRVLINGGSGGVGIFAIQISKALGCAHVTAVCSARNADLCRSLGADDVIYYTADGGLVATLKQRGEQYDHILDAVFVDPSLYWQSHHYLKTGATYVCVGLPVRVQTLRTLAAIYLLPRWLGGGRRKFVYHSTWADPEDIARMARWMEEGRVRVVVEEEFELEGAGAAYAMLKMGRTRGKLVVRVGGEPSNTEFS